LDAVSSLSALDLKKRRALSLQARICKALPELPTMPEDLLGDIGDHLVSGFNEGILRDHPGKIWSTLRLSSNAVLGGVEFVIVLGEKDQKRNQRRDMGEPHFERKDGAWFDFAITAFADYKAPVALRAYSFAIRLPGEAKPPFVRFDLNKPGHENEQDGERCHLHPGSDDFSVPAPLMGPLEILDVFLYGVEIPARPRAS
jgi:hypothetical protein